VHIVLIVAECLFCIQKVAMQYSSEAEQQMFTMITRWQQSGLTQKDYCEQHSIRYHVFHYWYKKYRDMQSVPVAALKEHSFISLQVKHAAITDPIIPLAAAAHTEMILPDGRRLLFHQGVSADYLKALIS
jgi:hypothetical protein